MQGAPALAWECRSQRADALRGDDGNALWLARQAKELFIADRLVFTDRGEVLVFIAEEQDLAEVVVLVCLDGWDAVQDGAFEIELQHHAKGFGETGVHADGEIQSSKPCRFR